MTTTRRPVARRHVTREDYLRIEEASPLRHEWVAGRIYALSGTTIRHNRILGNIFALLWTAARGGPCRVYAAEVKLSPAPDTIYYPDVMVACGAEREDELFENGPCLVVEITSRSTRAIDRREKLAAYRRIPRLQAYLIADQKKRLVERHWRENGEWWEQEVSGEGVVPIPCPACDLSLAEIYEGT
jgi:Uma2 family endonuclease